MNHVALDSAVVGMAAAPSGHGYILLGGDGGIFTFGDARFRGSTGGMRLNARVLDLAVTSSGNGYWFVASDGGVFSFGDAAFRGSTGGMRLSAPVMSMASSTDGRGYWLVASDGGIFAFGVPVAERMMATLQGHSPAPRTASAHVGAECAVDADARGPGRGDLGVVCPAAGTAIPPLGARLVERGNLSGQQLRDALSSQPSGGK